MINIRTLVHFNDMQKDDLTKLLLGYVTKALLMAAVFTEMYENFSSEILVTKDYLMSLPVLLILIPFVNRLVVNNPIPCYQVKGALSIGGLILLLITELFDLSKVLYLVNAGIVSFTALIMIPHKTYYQSVVANKCRTFSGYRGLVDSIGQALTIGIGLGVVYADIPTVYLLIIALPLELLERRLDLRVAHQVFN